jgi:amidophosphoribosyltransferase
LDNAQPIEVGQRFALAHNGTILNGESLTQHVGQDFQVSASDSDTRLVGLRLLQILKQEDDWFQAFKRLSDGLIGAYCFVWATNDGAVFAARDPRGYRPLCLGWREDSETLFAASESCALTAMEAALVRDVEPGEMVRMGPDGLTPFRFAPRIAPAYCPFEYTYFAHPSSRINGINVYEARKRIGRILAARSGMTGHIVVPVPDSARPAALGFAQESNVPLDEGLMKDRYRKKGSMRSFIEPTQGSREEIVGQLIPIKEVVAGKDVVVVDDSIVRGTSSRAYTRLLRSAGAKRVAVAITFPPIVAPCYMGIDFPSREELLVPRLCREEDGTPPASEMAKLVAPEIGADQVWYNDVEGLSEGIGIPQEHLCLACVSGDYSKLGMMPAFKSREQMKG